ncbi:hypothetical protein ERX46_15530 [Brumimicrobium glaciale]|uniref:Proteinase inhibitor I42 chagasin domain-containing protein n=1 Tax=Brumimicrobium glaciale TaxID=200475 RepID=A0A4Q4KG55_9FLAO|nr:hypothetical protein [Brumimicrobium glaciale]RYM32092.1 hypothetical protein ERX46_15530 [Brumimicrobium glaciale]
MKSITSVFVLALFMMTSVSQVQGQSNNDKRNSDKITSQSIANYRLFSTEIINTFIKLNTQNGLLWQVQIDIEDERRYETFINTLPLVENENEVTDRFTLHGTYNIYTFILLDQIDGRMWQVYWSDKPEERDIILIK